MQPAIKIARTARAFLCLIDLSKDFTGVKMVAILQSHTATHVIKRTRRGDDNHERDTERKCKSGD